MKHSYDAPNSLTSKRCGIAGSKDISGVPQSPQNDLSRSAKRIIFGIPFVHSSAPVWKKVHATACAPLAFLQSSQWQRHVRRAGFESAYLTAPHKHPSTIMILFLARAMASSPCANPKVSQLLPVSGVSSQQKIS